jgi:hypothetical protein
MLFLKPGESLQDKVLPNKQWHDSLPEELFNHPDTIVMSQNSTVQDSIIGTFLQDGPVNMVEKVILPSPFDWITYLLLVLIAGLAIIVFLAPERLNLLFAQSLTRSQMKSTDRTQTGPGIGLQMFFLLNYLATTGLFILIVLDRYQQHHLFGGYFLSLVLIMSLLLIFFLFRIGLIRLLGILFETKSQAILQQRLFRTTDFLIGILLIPFVLLSIYLDNPFLTIAGFIAVFIVHIFRWFQTFFLGNSIPGVFAIHIFMYLCTLEIAPIIVVVKLLQTL